MRHSKSCLFALLMAVPIFAQAGLSERQLKLLNINCVPCHAGTQAGSPLMGDPQAWSARISKGEEALLRNLVQGMPGMPPLGYCFACSEADLRALIQTISGLEGRE